MSGDWGRIILQALITSLLSSAVIAGLVNVLFKRRTEQIAAEVKRQFEQELLRYRSTRTWSEQVLSELLGPIVMQLDRTGRAFARWQQRNAYIETKIMKVANETTMDLLLRKGHLIPPDLLDEAGRLVEHYDRWLEEYDRVRGGAEPQLDEPFVFAGPKGYPFPIDAEKKFKQRFEALWRELYEPHEIAV